MLKTMERRRVKHPNGARRFTVSMPNACSMICLGEREACAASSCVVDLYSRKYGLNPQEPASATILTLLCDVWHDGYTSGFDDGYTYTCAAIPHREEART